LILVARIWRHTEVCPHPTSTRALERSYRLSLVGEATNQWRRAMASRANFLLVDRSASRCQSATSLLASATRDAPSKLLAGLPAEIHRPSTGFGTSLAHLPRRMRPTAGAPARPKAGKSCRALRDAPQRCVHRWSPPRVLDLACTLHHFGRSGSLSCIHSHLVACGQESRPSRLPISKIPSIAPF
jgi:hypothetical protein